MEKNSTQKLSDLIRVVLAVLLPLTGALIFSFIVTGQPTLGERQPGLVALQLAGIGLVSWIMGWRLYGLRGLGMKIGRPLSAGAGFAFLAWIVFLLVRLATVVGIEAKEGVPFIYLLLFEAFCTQLWTYGLFFRTVVDWRGPLAATVSSGLLFGAIGLMIFQEVFAITATSILFFSIWGILYGFMRLRSGSFIGIALVQALQSWSTWQLNSVEAPELAQLRTFYLITSVLFVLYIWRLWPKKEKDYRI